MATETNQTVIEKIKGGRNTVQSLERNKKELELQLAGEKSALAALEAAHKPEVDFLNKSAKEASKT